MFFRETMWHCSIQAYNAWGGYKGGLMYLIVLKHYGGVMNHRPSWADWLRPKSMTVLSAANSWQNWVWGTIKRPLWAPKTANPNGSKKIQQQHARSTHASTRVCAPTYIPRHRPHTETYTDRCAYTHADYGRGGNKFSWERMMIRCRAGEVF